jgi:coenzyme F420-reducing hydrogenase delta subunit
MKKRESAASRILLFFCTRQRPEDFPGLQVLALGPGEVRAVEVPCSGRVGTGDIMQGLAAGYDKVAVLSCGERSCLYSFGCREAKKAMARARRAAEVGGIDPNRLIFIEADDPEIQKIKTGEKRS